MRVRKSAVDRKAEIVRAALDLAFDVGPDRVTTAMIAQRLGLTQPAIYRHFPSKEDIWGAAIDHLSDRIDGNITAVAQEAAPDKRLRRLLLDHVRVLQDNPALPEIMVMRDPGRTQIARRSQILASMAQMREVLTRTVAEAQSLGRYRDDIDAADCATLIIGVIQSLALRLLRFRDPENLLSDGERLLDLQLRLFARNGEPTCDPG